MASNMISFSTTNRGKKLVVDKNNFTYTSNAKTQTVNYWICSENGCKARLRTRISSSNLVGRPAHRRQPLFGHDTWNVFQEMQKNEPILTNNSLESWNRS